LKTNRADKELINSTGEYSDLPLAEADSVEIDRVLSQRNAGNPPSVCRQVFFSHRHKKLQVYGGAMHQCIA